jgi:zinc/manganese transport system substrate-binding protein
VTVSQGVKPLKGEGEHALDPHAWQDVANVRLYVGNIRDALAAADPDHKADYTARAQAYLARLDALDADIRSTITAIPTARRRVITSHDAFGYFGHAYGMDFIAPQGVSTETDASARDVAKIIRQIRAEKIPAVFLENVSDPRLMERIAKETGAKIGDKVYSDALSPPGGPAATYLDMMRHNLKAFAQALGA